MSKLRVQTDTLYDSAEAIAEAIEKEKAYAKTLGKLESELTATERGAAATYEPPKEKKRSENKARKPSENKSRGEDN